MSTPTRATIDDLYAYGKGKAELVNGKLIPLPPSGDMPNRAAGAILLRLHQHEAQGSPGRVFGGSAAFLVDLPRRKSFCADVAWHVGRDTGMRFLDGAPLFAVEVRSEYDYGPAAEREMTEKRSDYFAAGTLVVWDVDLLSDDVVRVYQSTDPEHPTVFRRGQMANAEPAVPGWSMPVEELFT